jgi:hypothetical protein
LIVRVRKIAFVGLKYQVVAKACCDPAGFESCFATWSALLPPVEGWPGSSLAEAKPDGAAMTTVNIDAATRIVMLIICVFPDACLFACSYENARLHSRFKSPSRGAFLAVASFLDGSGLAA